MWSGAPITHYHRVTVFDSGFVLLNQPSGNSLCDQGISQR